MESRNKIQVMRERTYNCSQREPPGSYHLKIFSIQQEAVEEDLMKDKRKITAEACLAALNDLSPHLKFTIETEMDFDGSEVRVVAVVVQRGIPDLNNSHSSECLQIYILTSSQALKMRY